MRKYTLPFIALVVALFVSCEPYGPYRIGDVGPAGGYIIYDCDKDNYMGNADGLVSTECGWRYIEIAPSLAVKDERDSFVFGYQRSSSTGTNKCSNGSTSISNSLTIGIGTGKENTRRLVEAMGGSTYSSSYGSAKTQYYAAKIADDYSVAVGGVTYDDWFLPSQEELCIIYRSGLKTEKFDYIWNGGSYWTSSESTSDWAYLFTFHTSSCEYGVQDRMGQAHVICVRTFLPEE